MKSVAEARKTRLWQRQVKNKVKSPTQAKAAWVGHPATRSIFVDDRDYHLRVAMIMYNPAHPGELVREQMGNLSVSELATHLGVSRVTLSRLLNGRAGISAEMPLRLSEAFGTSAELWLKMQIQYDLWHASRKRRKKVQPINQDAA